jgi:YHS domain-containing protein
MKYVYIVIAVVVLAVGVFATVKKVSPAGWGWWGTTNTEDGIALRTYDAVSYFSASGPMPGSAEITHEWEDATWHFASDENREQFAENPRQYAPQFGGFCTFAMSKGFTADSTPDAWHIADGHLYVFADTKVRDDWVDGLGDGSLEASETAWQKR